MRKVARGDLLVCAALVGAVALSQSIWSLRTQLRAGIRVVHYPSSAAVYLEYGRRMRTGFAFQVRAMCGQNADLIKKFKAGGYQGRKDEFEADTTSFCNSLEGSIEQFDGQKVPTRFEVSHAKISECHSLCRRSVQTLRLAYVAQGGERKRLVRKAENELKWA